jgi:hypothetical protein
MQVQQEVGKKRLSLDVFQEKAIGNTQDMDQNGGAAASTLLCSVIIVSIIFTLSSDSSRCCQSSDCHPS